MSTPLAINTEAPDFTLESTEGSTVTLSDLRENKNVLLVFYPKNNTPG